MKPGIQYIPFLPLFKFAVSIKNVLYDKKVIPQGKLPVPVISIGNIVAGGSGKTPFTIYLAGLLKQTNIKPAILSRGYGRKSTGFVLVSDGNVVENDVAITGDEPNMIARMLPGVPVAVCEDRIKGGIELFNRFHPDVILLDDAFQHRRLARDMDIVLHPAYSDYKYRWMLPVGYLREPLSAFNRSHLIILTHGTESQYEKLEKRITGFLNRQIPIYRLQYKYQLVPLLSDDYNLENIQKSKINAMAVTGIANPEQFFEQCRQKNIHLKDTLSYPDHYFFSEEDILRWEKKAQESGVSDIIVTRKDAVKLSLLNHKTSLRILVLDQIVHVNDENLFLSRLLDLLSIGAFK